MTADLHDLARITGAWPWDAMRGAAVQTPAGRERIVDVLPGVDDDPDGAAYLVTVEADRAADTIEPTSIPTRTWYVQPESAETWDSCDQDTRGEMLLDLGDPATLGCLLALVHPPLEGDR